MIELVKINKFYEKKKQILKDVSFIFEENKIYPLLGGRDSGKTSLLECISNDVKIDSGKVLNDKKQDPYFVSKQAILPMYITGREYLDFLKKTKRKQTMSIKQAFELVGIDDKLADTMIFDCNFEEKKRIQLASVLVLNPYAVLFDEPLDYCSDELFETYMEVLNKFKEGHIVIISTGLYKVASKIDKDILVLNKAELSLVEEEMFEIDEIKNAVLEITGESKNVIK